MIGPMVRVLSAATLPRMSRVSKMLRRGARLLVTVLLTSAPLLAMQPPTGAATDGFVPIDQLPPQEQLPAAPLLITAYAVVWVLLMAYLWSIAKRLRKVESEVETLERRSAGAARR
ncbi:MAG: CcmD family protein [Acidimicrobiia bacterium]|nr:CcmD family protein [Acidimicrobiia bacterium]